MALNISSETRSVTLDQDLDDLVVALSPWVMVCLLGYCERTSMTAFSASRTKPASTFSLGTVMSSMPMEMPARVAERNPSDL